jgi:membrane fusion protein, multidrug efflux system
VRAPFSGEIARRAAAAGDFVKVGTPLFEVVQTDPLRLRGEAPERFLADVKKGAEIEVKVDAYPDQVFHAKVTRLAPTIDPKTRAFLVEATLPNRERLLRAGGFAHAFLRLGKERVLVAPETAVQTFAGDSKVWVVEGAGQAATVRAVPVELVRRLDQGAVVRPTGGAKALAAGAKVVVSGGGRLGDGMAVEVLP